METSLNKIIKTYVINEFKHQRPEHENGDSVPNKRQSLDSEESLLSPDEEYIEALQECLEKKGVMRELQAFLRQKMVLILQDKWPKLVVSPLTELINPTIIKLLEDFLCSRRLLYTFSVLSSELGHKSSEKVNWGKMSCKDAEKLLEQISIKKDSKLSRRVLKFYSDKEEWSLLECIIHTNGWSEIQLKENPFSLIESGNQRHKKFETKYKQIDEFFDTKKNTSKTLRQLGAEERFHAIERGLEDDKKIQLQCAVKKFKEEEMERIKEELDHKMKFEILSKENELLLNYKEKTIIMNENLAREKAAWVVEKSRQEQEIEEKRQELETMMTIISKSQDTLGCTSPKIQVTNKTAIKADSEGKILSEEIKETDADLLKHYEKVDDFLMREAELRVAVKRLQEENQKLLIEREIKFKKKVPVTLLQKTEIEKGFEESSRNSNSKTEQKVDPDTIVFLQYNLEQQAEEIRHLKHQLYLDNQNPKKLASSPSTASTTKTPDKYSNDLLSFLAESKRRCEKIEDDSREVDNKLQNIQNRRSRTSISPISYVYPNPKPLVSRPYSTMSKLMLEQIQPLHSSKPQDLDRLVLMPRPVQPLRTVSASSIPSPTKDPLQFENSWIKPILGSSIDPLEEDKITKKSVVLREIEPNTLDEKENIQESSMRNSGPNDPIVFDDEGKCNSKVNHNSPTTSDILEEIKSKENKLMTRKKSESEKLEKAVKKGALSFEKISSDDGESSQSSSIRQDLSWKSRGSRKTKAERSEPQRQQLRSMFIGGDEDESSINKSKAGLERISKTRSEDDVSGEEMSLAVSGISAVYDISHGGSVNLDEEFWKI